MVLDVIFKCLRILKLDDTGYMSETEQDPAEPSQIQKPLCVPCFLFVEKRLQLPKRSVLNKDQNVTNRVTGLLVGPEGI